MRVLALLLAVVALAVPSVAAGQTAPGAPPSTGGGGSAFSPIPPAPAETPVPAGERDDDGSAFGRRTLYIVLAAVLLALVGLGVFITRDARKAVPSVPGRRVADGPDLVPGAPGERRAKQKSKKDRQKAKAARAARKRTTRRR